MWTVPIKAADRVHLARSRTPTAQLAWRVKVLHTLALDKTVCLAMLRVSSTLIAPHAQRVRQAEDLMKTGRSASAVWARRSPRSGSAKTVPRRVSWTVPIRAAARVHLARSRTSIAQRAWCVQALPTLALDKTVCLAMLRMLSTLIAPHAQRVRQAGDLMRTGRSASAVWARRSPRSGSAKTVLHRT